MMIAPITRAVKIAKMGINKIPPQVRQPLVGGVGGGVLMPLLLSV